MPYSSVRPAGDRVEPDVRDVEVEELPHVGAVGVVHEPRRMSLYFAGRWFSNRSGGSTTWSSTLTRIMSSLFMAVPSVGSTESITASANRCPVPRSLK